jgi:two-component system, NtrC family, nitrogen regulation sensor histidine kinase NtrY
MSSDPSINNPPYFTLSQKQVNAKKSPPWRTITWILLALLFSTSLEYYFLQEQSPASVKNNLAVLLIFNIILILLFVLVVLITRNLVKLYSARKSKILGSKFQTKLIVAFLILTLVPSVLLFTVANKLFTFSIGSWFNVRIEQTLQQSMDVAQEYYASIEQRSLIRIQNIEEFITKKELFRKAKRIQLNTLIQNKREEYAIGGIILYDDKYKPIASKIDKKGAPYVESSDFTDLLKKSAGGEGVSEFRTSSQGHYLIVAKPLTEKSDNTLSVWGYIVTLTSIPGTTQYKIKAIQNSYETYKRQSFLKLPISATYYSTFLMITLLILFSAIWLGFYMAQGITVPIQLLAEGTRRISEGDLNFKLGINAQDEIGVLVDSFNRMTAKLNDSQSNVESANQDLKTTNIELEQRRQYIATILDNIGAGVVSIDKKGKITTFNKAATDILMVEADEVTGSKYRNVFEKTHLVEIRKIIREMISNNKESTEDQIEINFNESSLILLVKAHVLRSPGQRYLGIVIVFEDLTLMIKTQKIAAWKEVAQGIAHEIKNPLTPIQLNTQRLKKKYHEDKEVFDKVFEESIDIISQEVEGMKDLVNEFLRFARMPAPSLKPHSLHKIINNVYNLYKNNSKNIAIKKNYDPNIVTINIDSEQFRRIFINLFENSIDALEDNGKIEISTMVDFTKNKIFIRFSDDGTGISIADRDKLFLPHFTTKKRGTGLGLAIVNRIVVDHSGTITVKNNHPKGTTFEIQIPRIHVPFNKESAPQKNKKKNFSPF